MLDPEGALLRQAVEDRKMVQRKEDASLILDLNDGTIAQLEVLPGIGRILAERIVTHRTSHGAFRRIEELALVPGIGDKRLQQLRPFVVVRETTANKD